MPRPLSNNTTIALLLALAAATGCSSSPRFSPAGAPIGVFNVSERVLQTHPPVTIEGKMTVLRDTLLIDMTPGPCRPLESSPQGYVYQCANEVRLWFDRRDPVQRNSYSVTTTAYISKRRCESYARDASGVERCVRYGTETVEEKATRIGRLRPQRP